MTAQRHRGLTEQAADAAVDQACRMLRLPTIRTQFGDVAEYWGPLDIDLTGATLIEFNLTFCHVGIGKFMGARFIGAAFFREANFPVGQL